MATVLGTDMFTILDEIKIVPLSEPYSKGGSFEGHACVVLCN